MLVATVIEILSMTCGEDQFLSTWKKANDKVIARTRGNSQDAEQLRAEFQEELGAMRQEVNAALNKILSLISIPTPEPEPEPEEAENVVDFGTAGKNKKK